MLQNLSQFPRRLSVEMDRDHSEGYVCVHCGSPMNYLIKTYSPTVLELVNCDHCGNVADRYLEYDEVIILIDVILFNKQAYRHVLFNTKFQNHWKLALLILITKTTDEWYCFSSDNNLECHTKTNYENTIYSFFFNFLVTISGEFLFFSLVAWFFIYFWNRTPKDLFTQEVKIIWKAIVSSSFGYFLLLPSLIWSDFQTEIRLIFIFIYTLLSHIQALTVVYKIERYFLAGLLILASFANYMLCLSLRWFFNTSVL